MRPLAVAGAVVAVFGFVALFQRGVAGFFDFGYGVVTLVGVLALVQGIRYGLDRRGADRPMAELGDPETRYEVTAPGADIDERIRRIRGFSRGAGRRRNRLRERVREVAVDAIATGEGVSHRVAGEQLDAGDWTADRVAAAFLSEEVSYPVRAHLTARFRGESTFSFGLSRAIDAIEEEFG